MKTVYVRVTKKFGAVVRMVVPDDCPDHFACVIAEEAMEAYEVDTDPNSTEAETLEYYSEAEIVPESEINPNLKYQEINADG